MIKGMIDGQHLKLVQPIVVADTINYLGAEFTFSADWDGLRKTAFFVDKEGASHPFLLDTDGKASGLNLSSGDWDVHVVGYSGTEPNLLARVTTDVAKLIVRQSGIVGDEPLPPVEPTIAEQIMAQLAVTDGKVSTATGAAELAEAAATSAAQSAESAANTAADAEIAASQARTAANAAAAGVATLAQDVAQLDAAKMQYAILTFDGSAFKDTDGNVLTFEQIKTLCLDDINFVYAQYASRLYIPQYVTSGSIFFEANYIQSDVPYMHRISINSNNVVSQYSMAIANKEDLSDLSDSVIKGVKVAGTELIKDADGAVNVPYSTEGGAGVIRGGGYGASPNTAGRLACSAISADVYKTVSDNYFISKGTLRNILAAPSIMPALTTEERVEELKRIGLFAGGMEKITITLEKQSSSIHVDLKDKKFSGAIFEIITPTISTKTVSGPAYLYVTDGATDARPQLYCYPTYSRNMTNNMYILGMAFILNGVWNFWWKNSSTSRYYSANSWMMSLPNYKDPMSVMAKNYPFIDELYLETGTSDGFDVGTIVNVYGVKL